MDSLQLIGILLGATGFWKLVEILFKVRADRRLRKAQAENLKVNANTQIIDNWVRWAHELEKRLEEQGKRINELESEKERMEKTINRQRSRINDLERQNADQRKQLKELKNGNGQGQ